MIKVDEIYSDSLLWILFDFQSYYNGIVNGFVLIGLFVAYARF